MASTSRNGVLVAAGLILVGAAAAGVAWWNTLSQTQLALDYWGPEGAVLVRDAPHVEAMEIDFQDAGGDGPPSDFERRLLHPQTGAPARVGRTRDISRARGLVHLRHALLDDRSFDWTAAPGQPGDLGYALTFEQDGRRLIVYLSRDFKRLVALGPVNSKMGEAQEPPSGPIRRTVSAEPIANGLERYFADTLSAGSMKDGKRGHR